MAIVDKKTLLTLSFVADILDFALVGQIPGLSWFIDIPLILMHVAYAGPGALYTIAELIPGVGFIPIFTFAALSHENND